MKKTSTNGPNRNIRYSAVDKLKAVKLYLEDGYPAKQVAEQFGVSKSSLTQWARMYVMPPFFKGGITNLPRVYHTPNNLFLLANQFLGCVVNR